jgi:flagellar assembly protein FliH
MSNSVIRSAALAEAPVVIGEAGDRFMPPGMQAMLEAAKREARADGFRAGRESAVAEVQEAANAARHALSEMVEETRIRLDQAISQRAPELVELAIEFAKHIVGEAAVDPGRSLAERLLAALEQIDDDQLRIRVNPEDFAQLEDLMPPGVELEADPRLGRGDAVASGRWSRADLTLERAWQLIAGATDA